MNNSRGLIFLVVSISLAILSFELITVRTNIGDFIFSNDANNDGESDFRIAQLKSDELERRYLISIEHQNITPSASQAFLSAFKQSLAEMSHVRRVWDDLLSQSDIEKLLEFYSHHQIPLLSLEPEDELNRLLSRNGMNIQAELIKESLLGPDPSLVKPLLIHDPMLLTLSWLSRVGIPFEKQQQDRNYSNFFLETHQSGLETAAQQDFQNAMLATFDSINTDYDNQFSLQFTGVPAFSVEIRKQVSQDIQRISALSIVVVILLAWVVFRSFKTVACLAVMLVATASASALFTQWVYGYLHGLTLALGTTLIGVCIDYFIHALIHGEGDEPTDRLQAIRRIWPALIIGGTTTLIGYTALSFSGFPGLQQVAVFTGSGIIFALLITRYVLPDLVDLFSISIQPRINCSRLMVLNPIPKTRYIIIACIFSFMLMGSNQIKWSDDFGPLTLSLKNLKETDRSIRDRLSSIEPGRFVIVSGENMQMMLKTAETVQKALSGLHKNGSLDTYYPLFPWLASDHVQRLNIQTWKQSLTPDLQKQWESALSSQGLRAAAFPKLSQASEQLLTTGHAISSPAEKILGTQLIKNDHGPSSVIWLGTHDVDRLQEALQPIPNARYFSQKDRVTQVAKDYRLKAQDMLTWGLVVIFVLLGLRYRSLISAVQVLTPAALSLMLLLGAWGISESPMGILHLIGLLLTAAVCVDYGVFFMENGSRNRQRTLQAISTSAITTAAAFASLSIAENPALHALAWTVAPGVIAGFLFCPIMLGHTEIKA
ncbi:MAG TPA: hypothetical protein EYM99_06425 [Alphaproteobacteria bacterium]|jgi:predicted exporter|nr:hypothetical protein [Alphaproteobacteria bacterium]